MRLASSCAAFAFALGLAPSALGQTAPSADRAVPSDTGSERPPEMTLGVQLDFGLGTRLGDSGAYDFQQKQSGGMAFGPSVWFSPSRLWSVGASYRRYDLGTDAAPAGADMLEISRSLDLFWLGGRAYPWRTDTLGIYLTLGLGLGWQHAGATGTQVSADYTHPTTTFVCSGSDGPGLALGGGLGLDVDLDRNFAFFTQIDTFAHRQSGDVIGGCVPGSGSVTTLGASLGLAYRFDLDEPQASARRGSSALLR